MDAHGELRPDLSIGLAPMEGVSDFPCRLWFSILSDPSYMSTPFCRLTPGLSVRKVSDDWAPELFRSNLKEKLRYHLTPQMMAADPNLFVAAAKDVLEIQDLVELNCGCPAPKPVGNGAGSALLADPLSFARFIATIQKKLPANSLSIKMRLGFSGTDRFDELLAALFCHPLNRVVVHGRTRDQRYKGYADWEKISEVAKTAPFPVIGSGDICDAQTLISKLAIAPDLSGIIIGRGALRNPWLFHELKMGKTALPTDLLLCSLEVFAYLNELYRTNLPALFSLIEEGFFAIHYGKDLSLWHKLQKELKSLCPEILRPSLGRVKMLWNYLRSSLDPAYFNPQLLRNSQLDDLLAGIAASSSEPQFTPQWQAQYDWIYSGETNEARKAASS